MLMLAGLTQQSKRLMQKALLIFYVNYDFHNRRAFQRFRPHLLDYFVPNGVDDGRTGIV
ncbi:hypothetical protein LI291_14310 [Intestinibacillus massiliensis]|nr:hypothetical protein [Intestinibacillus massiliensis]